VIGTRFAGAQDGRGDPRDAGNIPSEFAAGPISSEGTNAARSRRGVQLFTRAPRGDTHGRVVGAMELREATDLIRHTLVLALIVSAPMLLIGLAVGIIVSLIQAVTQIQEQTLTFIPKIVAMVAAAILLMPWIGHRLVEYSAAMFMNGSP
jgi:flagellar biosynthesis protein FliQ